MEPGTENQSCCGGCSGLCNASNSNPSNSSGSTTTSNGKQHNTTTKDCSSNNQEGGFFLVGKHRANYPEGLVQLLDSETMDSYTAGIELSNACREFYVKRQKDAESFKFKLSGKNHSEDREGASSGKTTTIKIKQTTGVVIGDNRGPLQTKMNVLKEQLASLVDQDLLLMKQFLTLNERIEELKWQRKMESYQLDHTADSTLSTASSSLRRSLLKTHKASSSSSTASSRMMSTEFLDLKYPTPSELSLFNECSTETLGPSNGDLSSIKKGKTLVDIDYSESEQGEETGEYEDYYKASTYSTRTSTLDKFMFKTTASMRHSDCSNHQDVVGHCVHCPRNLMNLGQVNKDQRLGGAMFRTDSGHFTEESKCSTLSSTCTDSGDRHPENTSFDSGISDQENQSDFVVEV